MSRPNSRPGDAQTSRSVHNELTRRLVAGWIRATLVWLAILVVVYLVGFYICSQVWWYGFEPLYPLLSFVRHHPVGVIATLCVFGAFVIFVYYWRKTLLYMDSVIRASEQLVSEGDQVIELPDALHNVADRLNAAKRRAVEAERVAAAEAQRKNDLLVYLAHDLKTPLTSVIGYLQLLHDEQDISPELRRRYEGVALDRAERLEELVNEFFEVARLNLSEASLAYSQVNLGRMVEQVMFEYQPIMEPKRLSYTVDAEQDLAVVCDVNKIERVFDNLVRNAVNYAHPQTSIDVSLKRQEPQAEDSQPFVELRIANDGDPIPSEQLERLFDQFYRLSSSRDSNTGGSGLGLAIAKGIVEAHGGTIHAESAQGRITFVVLLPQSPQPAA